MRLNKVSSPAAGPPKVLAVFLVAALALTLACGSKRDEGFDDSSGDTAGIGDGRTPNCQPPLTVDVSGEQPPQASVLLDPTDKSCSVVVGYDADGVLTIDANSDGVVSAPEPWRIVRSSSGDVITSFNFVQGADTTRPLEIILEHEIHGQVTIVVDFAPDAAGLTGVVWPDGTSSG